MCRWMDRQIDVLSMCVYTYICIYVVHTYRCLYKKYTYAAATTSRRRLRCDTGDPCTIQIVVLCDTRTSVPYVCVCVC